jgi:hypothetical protein
MVDAKISLRELAADCLVRLGTDLLDSPDDGGSGVWVAPGLILTCAHVVPAGADSKIQVGWGGHAVIGTVVDHVANPGQHDPWPFPDLALVSVPNPPAHPCAWLSESVPVDGASLVAFGHSGHLGHGLQQSSVEGRLSGWHRSGDGRFWQFKGNELVSGMSGGPVLDLASGAVCAIVTTTIGEGGDRGGYLVPVVGLRHPAFSRRRQLWAAHDRFHRRDRRWTDLRKALPPQPAFTGCPIEPDNEVDLLGLLAGLPARDPAELLTMLAGGETGALRPPDSPPDTLRDVIYGLLDGCGPGADWVVPILRISHQLETTGSDGHPELHDWATAVAAQHGQSRLLQQWRQRRVPDEPAPGGVITVEIAPGAAQVDRFRLTVSVEDEQQNSRRLYRDEAPRHTLDEVKVLVCEQLRNAVCWLQGNAFVEFLVPIELFEEPFDELVPTKPWTNVGRKHPVVLRDYDRQHDPTVRYDWQRRWQRLREPSHGVRWAMCTDDPDPDDFSAELEEHPETSVVALARRPATSPQMTEMLRVALDSGVPVVAFRRGTCSEHDAGEAAEDCSGKQFQGAFEAVLAETPISDLPERIRMLRNRAARQTAAPADHACRGTVLVWDNPGRSTRRFAAVQEPPYRPLGDIE